MSELVRLKPARAVEKSPEPPRYEVRCERSSEDLGALVDVLRAHKAEPRPVTWDFDVFRDDLGRIVGMTAIPRL